jgi:hypothetical protein
MRKAKLMIILQATITTAASTKSKKNFAGRSKPRQSDSTTAGATTINSTNDRDKTTKVDASRGSMDNDRPIEKHESKFKKDEEIEEENDILAHSRFLQRNVRSVETAHSIRLKAMLYTPRMLFYLRNTRRLL